MFEQQKYLKSFFTKDIKKGMNDWEKNFITSLYNQKYEFSIKQKDVLNKIILKYKLAQQVVEHKIIYLPEANADGAMQYQTITTRKFRRMRGINTSKNGKK